MLSTAFQTKTREDRNTSILGHDCHLWASVTTVNPRRNKKPPSLHFRGRFRERTGPSPSGPFPAASPRPTCVCTGLKLEVLRQESVRWLCLDAAGPRWPGHRHGGRRGRWVVAGGSGWVDGNGKLGPGRGRDAERLPGRCWPWVSVPGPERSRASAPRRGCLSRDWSDPVLPHLAVGVCPLIGVLPRFTSPCSVVRFLVSPSPRGSSPPLHLH